MKTKIGKKVLAILLAVFAAMFAVGAGSMAYAATGDTPPHSKRITDNQDGTYTISLDIVGESEKKPNNVNVIVIFDTSGSMTTQRMNAAKNAVNSLANALYGYNTQSEPNTVQMALVQFATSSSIAQNPTNSQTTFTGAVNRLGNAQGAGSGGTNWESALQTANGVSFGDDDQTFVVFVSDGNPTFRTTQNGWNDWSQQYQQWGTGQETTQNIQRCYTTAVDDAQALATKVTPTNFFTIGAFGNVDRMEQLTNDAGSDASTNYYSAQNTAALNQAIADILAKIEMAGFADAEIDDGTTSTVTQSSGEVSHLLVVDESSYKYYRTGGDHGNMEPWTDAPEAELVNGTVEWDLSEVGVLENGVRYTVTFDCYPSQETYDIIAQLKNGDITYDSLDSEIKKYIVDNGGGSYSLRTNTNASIAWDDTRDDAGRQTSGYTNPDPVATDSETLTASKEWEGGSADVDELEITVLMDDEEFHTTTISEPDWSTSSFISIGIIKNGNVLPGAEGHDFKFAELGSEQYHWELESPVVRPMLIDGGGEDHTPTMLVMVDDAHPAPSGAETYTIEGKEYYADTSAAGLTAVNHRRSNLNLTKVVTGEDAPADAMFPFELTVNNSKAPETAPSASDDPKHESDYWVWLSVRDENNQGVTGLDMGDDVVEDSGGYYYAPSGTTFSLEIGADWSLRFLNLPTDTTYTFEEGTLPEGFAFNKSELTQGEDSTFSGAQTTTGTIENTKTSYYVTYTNDYALTDLEITKEWVDNDNQDGFRLTPAELAEKLTLSPEVEGKTPTVVDNEDGTYTITYTGLPRFNNGQEVEYEVTEAAIDNYTTEGSPAEDHGTITNTHEPEETTVTVVKVWEDDDNIGKIRPASISVQLTADGTASGSAQTLNADNEWTYTWEDLPKYKDGEEIVYTADETAVPAGYDKTGPEKTTAEDGTVTFTVTNTYDPTPVSVDPPVQKVISNNDDLYNKGDFTFKIEAVSPADAPMPENTEITNSAEFELEGKAGFYEFGPIEFTMPGTYEYKVTESGEVDGVTNDPDAETGKTLTFTVTDDGEGNLTVSPTTDQVQLSFTNVYDANGEASIVVSKEITGAAWPEGKTLTLTLAGTGEAPMPEETTATLSAAGSVTFGPIAYALSDAGKTYTYTVTESSFGEGWSGAPASITATVEVTDNGDGTLSTEVTYDPEDAKFTNTYEATGEAVIKATKAIEGAAWPEDGEITFTLAGTASAPMPAAGGEAVTLTAAGTATFGAIAYDESDAGKTYTYTISEDGFGEGWTGSRDVTATVVVTDNGNGTLKTEVTYDPEDAIITNTYKAAGEVELKAGKKLAADEGLNPPDVSEKYTLTLEAQNGAPMPEGATDGKVEIKNVDGDGTMASFGTISFTEADAGKTYEYKVTESGEVKGVTNGTTEYTVKVKVVDKGDGTLDAQIEQGSAETLFTNTYSVEPTTANFPVMKVLSVPEGLTGPSEWEYTIKVEAQDGAPAAETMTGTVTNEKDTVSFGDFTYTKPGEYKYKVTESGEVKGVTNDSEAESGKTVTVTVEDKGDGTLEAAADYTSDEPLTFTNTYSVKPTTASFPVKKILSVPEGLTGPSEWEYTIKVEAQDDAPVASAMSGTVDQDGDTVTFGPITYNEPGTFTYKVTETGTVAGVTNDSAASTGKTVTVKVTDEGDGTLSASADYTSDDPLTFTNTYSVLPTDTDVPVALKAVEYFPLVYLYDEEAGTGQFSFEVKDSNGEVVSTGTNDAEGKVTFAPALKFEKPGEYTFTITEVNDGQEGIRYDKKEVKLIVNVVDQGNGTLKATAEYVGGNEFENTYNATGSVQLTAAKKLYSKVTGNQLELEANQFTFKVTAKTDGAPMPEKAEAGNNKSGKVDFGSITFDVSKIKEDAWTYENDKKKSDEAEESDSKIENKADADEAANNDAAASEAANDDVASEGAADEPANNAESEDAAKKNTAESADNAEGEGATEAATDEAANQSEAAAADESAAADEGASDEAAAEGTEASEDEESSNEVDETTESASFKIFETAMADDVDEADAGFVDEGEISDVTETEAAVAETEVVDAAVTATADEATEGEADGAVKAAEGEATEATEGAAEEPAAEGAKVRRTATFEYTISEVAGSDGRYEYDSSTANITVTVTDDGKGKLTAEITKKEGNKGEFTNYFTPDPVQVDPPVKKVIKGNSDLYNKGDFTFTIKGSDGAPMPKNTSITNSAKYEFPGKTGWYEFGVISFDKPGTYEYTVDESGSVKNVTNDSQPSKKFTFTVSEDAKGNLSVSPETDDACWTFTNVYSKNNPGIEIEKEVVSTPKDGKKYQEGETVKYEITVTNTGDVDLTDVVVTDDLTGDEWTLDKLAVGESKTFKTSYKVTKSDAEAGEVVNQATVTAKDPDGKKVSDKDKKKVPTGKTNKPSKPSRSIPKTGDTTPIVPIVVTILAAAAVAVIAGRRMGAQRRR